MLDIKRIREDFDGEYLRFVENGNTYSCPDLPGITIVLTEENNRWLVTYTVPTTYSNKYVIQIFFYIF